MADSSRPGPALAALSAITARRRKLGTAGDPATSTQTAPVSYRVFHSGLRASALTMPVLAQ
jgi:hypothetical protein